MSNKAETINGTKLSYPSEYDRGRHIARIHDERWNKEYPYAFVVVDSNSFDTQEYALGWGTYKLPFPPSDLSMTTPFAINVQALHDGALEEHNGVVFRTISLSGTTGVLPTRENAISLNSVAASSRVVTSLVNLGNGVNKLLGNLVPSDEPNKTGYTYLHELSNYLVAYAEAKRKPENKHLRLVFLDKKDNLKYYVTPQSFSWRKAASSPHTYSYSLQLKAIGLMDQPLKLQSGILDEVTDPSSPSALQEIQSKLAQTGLVLKRGRDVISAVGVDFNTVVGGAVRESTAIVKGLLGIPLEVADLGPDIQESIAASDRHLSDTGAEIKRSVDARK